MRTTFEPEMKNNILDFFDPIQQTRYIGDENCRKVEHYLKALQALSKLYDLSFYIVDYHKKSFYYVSPNPLFYVAILRKKY